MDRLHCSWVVNRFLALGLQITVLNTGFAISPTRPSFSSVNRESLSNLASYMERTLPTGEPILRLCIGHHPLKTNNTREVIVDNSAELEGWFRSTSTGIYLHGHGHKAHSDKVGDTFTFMAPTNQVNVQNNRQGFGVLILKKPLKKRVDIANESVPTLQTRSFTYTVFDLTPDSASPKHQSSKGKAQLVRRD
jgi:hypothetical protein